MIEWNVADEKSPLEDGKYLVTIISGDSERKLGTSKFQNGRWLSPYVIAWMPLPAIEPYQGDSQKTRKKANTRNRRELAFNLRMSGLSYKKIAEQTGVGVQTATHDIQCYLRKKGSEYRCCTCEHAAPHYDMRWKCELINDDVTNGCGCNKYTFAEGRILCKECKHNTGRLMAGWDWVNCDIYGGTSERSTCEHAERKEDE